MKHYNNLSVTVTSHVNESSATVRKDILDGPEAVNPPPDRLAASGQREMAASEAAAVEAAALAALAVGLASGDHFASCGSCFWPWIWKMVQRMLLFLYLTRSGILSY